MAIKRFWALSLMLSFLLAGCGTVKLASGEVAIETNSKVVQTKFQPEELDRLTQQVEYAMLAATFQMQEFDRTTEWYPVEHQSAYVGNLDQDGDLEMVYGRDALTFDISEDYHMNYNYLQSGNKYFVDKDNNIYLYSIQGVDYTDGDTWYNNYYKDYKTWSGESWETQLYADGEELYSYENNKVAESPYSVDFTGTIKNKAVTIDEWNTYVDDLHLTPLQTTTVDYCTIAQEKKHRNAVEQELFGYLQEHHDCGEKIVFDADDDGEKEAFIAVRNPLWLWKDSLRAQESYQDLKNSMVDDLDSNYTVVLVSDPGRNGVEISAYCISGYTDIDKNSLSYDSGFLSTNNMTISLSKDYASIHDLNNNQKNHVYNYITDRLTALGYDCRGYKWTDLSDSGLGELLCICENDGNWYALLFTLKAGTVMPIWQQNLSNSACYLVNWNGKQYLLDYYQWVSANNDVFNTSYNYSLLRFDAAYICNEEDYQSISYTNNEEDATTISNFFAQFNKYHSDSIIIGDPYKITGQQWASTIELDGGNMPQSSDESKLGYVQIEDPASFLFLREGPGKEYDPVLIDPSNEDSYVKQALGSPVTILEEVQTGDSENPVWVKLRIHYGDQEVIGYSSKRYIREAN